MRSLPLDRPGSVILNGAVTAAGAIAAAGSGGWSVRKTGTGNFVITFDKALPRAPTVIVHSYASTGAIQPFVGTPTQSGFAVTTINTNTTGAADQPFGFTVIL